QRPHFLVAKTPVLLAVERLRGVVVHELLPIDALPVIRNNRVRHVQLHGVTLLELRYFQHVSEGIHLMSAPQETQGTQILDRTVGILRSVSYGGDAGARLSDIAADCNLPAPTVRRILKRLVELGMLAQDAETRRYFVGTFLSELSERTPHYGNVFEPYMPFVDEVHAGCGDTIYLLAQSGHDCYCACRSESGRAVWLRWPICRTTISNSSSATTSCATGAMAMTFPTGCAA